MAEAYGAFGEFMKGGPCKRRFELWAHCVDEAHKSGAADVIDKCAQMTTLLQLCLDMNPDYYGRMMHFHTLLHRINAKRALDPEQ